MVSSNNIIVATVGQMIVLYMANLKEKARRTGERRVYSLADDMIAAALVYKDHPPRRESGMFKDNDSSDIAMQSLASGLGCSFPNSHAQYWCWCFYDWL